MSRGKYAYESGRSIGGVYSCTTCAIWLPQLHALVRTCDTEFTMSKYFARYVATITGMSGENADSIFQTYKPTAQSA